MREKASAAQPLEGKGDSYKAKRRGGELDTIGQVETNTLEIHS